MLLRGLGLISRNRMHAPRMAASHFLLAEWSGDTMVERGTASRRAALSFGERVMNGCWPS
jgi:hypothetical protein